MPNQPPDYITETLYRQLGPIETDHEERRIDEISQAVWDALLAKGWFAEERFAIRPPGDFRRRVLVIPLGDEHE